MKYSWPKLVNEMRNAAMEIVSFEGETLMQTMDFVCYFREQMRATDTFHPFNYDSESQLQRAFDRMVDGKCNYRSLRSYWAYKEDRENIVDAIDCYLQDTCDIIEEHFAVKWNFAPGYVPPKTITYGDTYEKAKKIAARTIRLVRTV